MQSGNSPFVFQNPVLEQNRVTVVAVQPVLHGVTQFVIGTAVMNQVASRLLGSHLIARLVDTVSLRIATWRDVMSVIGVVITRIRHGDSGDYAIGYVINAFCRPRTKKCVHRRFCIKTRRQRFDFDLLSIRRRLRTAEDG